MDTDQYKNEARKTVETIKEAADKAMGDAQSHASSLYEQASGAAQSALGQAQSALGQAKDAAGEGTAVVSRQVEANPISALVAAGAIGFVLGWLARG